MIQATDKSIKRIEIALHILIWAYIFTSPLFSKGMNDKINWDKYWVGIIFPLFLCILFYINYIWLIPKFLYENFRSFVIINILLIAVCATGEHLIMSMHLADQIFKMRPPTDLPSPDIVGVPGGVGGADHPIPPNMPHHHNMPHWFFIIRNVFIMFITVVLSTVVRTVLLWKKSEDALKEAELGRTAAELKNLRNQINPHFLLNTLNNIYALTEFDVTKAQKAIQELGKLLRYVLYDNQQEWVPLQKEIEFLRTYIQLMKIRVQQNVEVKVDFNVPNADTIQVAPLIFISLIENAFKHGISPTQPSFIHLKLWVGEEGEIRFTAVNSNFPKNHEDKAGSGIGLQQVQRRLELSYPKRFDWYYGSDESSKTYISSIVIYKTRNNSNA